MYTAQGGWGDSPSCFMLKNCTYVLHRGPSDDLDLKIRVEGGGIYCMDVGHFHKMHSTLKYLLDYCSSPGECIAGALWWRELVDLCKEVGLSGPYLVDGNKSVIEKEELRKILGRSTIHI